MYFATVPLKINFWQVSHKTNYPHWSFTVWVKTFSLDELHSALKAMNTAAVPGEDGLTVNFYLTFWNDIKIFLWNSFIHAFDTGTLSLMQ